MKTVNPLEEQLYPQKIEKLKRQERIEFNHPYQRGMIIHISNHKCISTDLIRNHPRVYQTLYRSICDTKISRDDIKLTKDKVPKQQTIIDIAADQRLLLVAGIHDYKEGDRRGGSWRNGEFQHTHFYVYNIHHYLPINPTLLKKRERQLIRNLQRYTNKANGSTNIKISPVGVGKYQFTDAVNPTNLYEYLLRPTNQPNKECAINYLYNNRNNPNLNYPIYYLYLKKNR